MSNTVLVTGAAGGVGLELVKLLSAANYEVIGIVLNDAEAARIRAAVPKPGRLVTLDLSDADRVAPALSGVLRPEVDLRAVVTCAAIWPGGPIETTPLAEFRHTFEVNTLGCLAIFQQCIPLLRRSRGRIVFVSSISGKVALPFNGAYTLSKFALEALGDTVRREVAKWGVHVSIIEPGPIRTPMVTAMAERLQRDRATLSPEIRALYGDLYDAFAKMLDEGTPTAADPSEVARAIMEVLRAEVPATRYEVGETARMLCGMARNMSDLQIDAVALGSVTARPNAPDA